MKWMVFFGLLLVSGFAWAGADSAFIDFERGWAFPQELGGLKYATAEKYEEASLGYSVFYREKRSSCKAEVSVYDLGLGSIPDGFAGEAIDSVLKGVASEYEWLRKSEKITNFKKRGSTVVPKSGDIRFASAVYQYVDAETPKGAVIQATYVTAFQNHFVKLRFTFGQADAGKAKAMAGEMVAQLVGMLANPPSEKELLLTSCSVFLNDPVSYGGRLAARHLTVGAKAMDNLNVYTHLFAWPTGYWSKPKNADLLIAAYFAGMLQVVVPQQLESGGEFEAFVAMLETYELLRSKEQIDDIPKIGEWAKHPDRRALYDELLVVE